MNNSFSAGSFEQMLLEAGSLYRPVEGDSMMPLLDQRTDLVKIVPTKGVLSKYELPLYRRPNGALVLHRILKVKKNYYVICGDNRTSYEKVPHTWVIGKAVGRLRADEYYAFEGDDFEAYLKQICAHRDSVLGRAGYYFSRFFPPLSQMRHQYPVLKKCAFLLPVFYVVRIVRSALRRVRLHR